MVYAFALLEWENENIRHKWTPSTAEDTSVNIWQSFAHEVFWSVNYIPNKELLT